MIDLSTSYARFQILNGVAEQAQWQMESSLAALPSATVHLLKSSQVTRSHNRRVWRSRDKSCQLVAFSGGDQCVECRERTGRECHWRSGHSYRGLPFPQNDVSMWPKTKTHHVFYPHDQLLWRIFPQWVNLPGSRGSISRLLLAAILTKVNTWPRTVALFSAGLLKCSTWFSGPPWRLRSGQSLRQRQWDRSCFLVGIIFSWPSVLSIRLRFPLWYNHIQQARSRRYDASHTFIKSLLTMWNHVLSVFRSLQPIHLRLSRRGVGFSLCGVQVRKRFFFFYILSPFPGSLLWAREQKIRRQPPFLSQQMVKSLRRVPWLQRSPFNPKVCIKHRVHIISTLKSDPAVYFSYMWAKIFHHSLCVSSGWHRRCCWVAIQ